MAGTSGGIEVIVREQAINVAIAVAVGIGVGLIEDVPIELVPDILILGLALGLIAQEALLVQRTGMIGGTYEKEMKEYTERMLDFFDSKAFWLFGILLTFFVLGMIPLLLSPREVGAVSVFRVACVALILTLGVDPILATLPKKDGTATVGSLVIYWIVIHSGLSGYPDLAIQLNSYIGTFSAVTSSSIALTYLLLSTRWTYIRNLCYGMADGWLEFSLYIGAPLLFILHPKIPEFLELVFRIYIGV
ncbi:MAG: hypothetical protein QGF28_06300 [Candidatus Thalassarchaeaceae archaeon]|jgi:hypothetical protein|nr:hypothetical protein [Candidatus Thalassarchaeaceae archaeon]MDP7091371.1 hypothetical protein [Candidatus Thalassarchaeaceae archaeon]MDP7256539.1 hypothetical protein [Candidatus Thalassarchaeaceae archaeon]MDP7446789.1 hypothetical protein [Candidatus Thalassarchaeaceae archaeon]MDP7648668.1 hypothetical protein [Candidatus Thalassarchaeaceae archaeon]|tara:strand:- start:139 stop:879 length:741 start_codon:yes stop_codon:yes gene_type:complete